MKPEHPICVALDLDHTLTRLVGAREQLYEYLERHGVPRTETARLMEVTVASPEGFSEMTFTAAATKKFPSLPIEEIQSWMRQWLKNTIQFYPETEEVMKDLRDNHTTAIITAGDESWQQSKLRHMGIGADHTFVVSPTEGKAGAISVLHSLTGKRIVYTDDKASELDRIRDVHGSHIVHTVHIEREDNKHKGTPARHEHEKITDLRDLPGIIKRLS